MPDVGPARRLAAAIDIVVPLGGPDGLGPVYPAEDLVGLRVLPAGAGGEQGHLQSFRDARVGLVGGDSDAVERHVQRLTGQRLARVPRKELGDVHHLVQGGRHRERVAVLGLESRHLFRVLEQVLAVVETQRVSLGREGIVTSRPARELAIVRQGGLGHTVGQAFLDEHLGQLDIVTLCGPLAQPLAVADDHVKGRAPGGPLVAHTVVEAAPGLLDHLHGRVRVFLDERGQKAGRIPLCPDDRQLVDLGTLARAPGYCQRYHHQHDQEIEQSLLCHCSLPPRHLAIHEAHSPMIPV